MARYNLYLTTREKEVLSVLDLPLKLPDIAESLYISTNTLRTHIFHIYTKLGMDGIPKHLKRQEALKVAKKKGLIKND